MHTLTGEANRIAGLAIENHSATLVRDACFSYDGVSIDYYFLAGRVIRCEYEAVYDETTLYEVNSSERKDFLVCHKIPQE